MHIKDLSTFISESRSSLSMQDRYADDPVRNAVWNYVAGYTMSEINGGLRKNTAGKSHRDAMALMDKAFTSKLKLDVWRTVEWKYLNNIYGITKENIDDFVGKTVKNPAYTSTTRQKINVWNGRPDWSDEGIMHEAVMHITSQRPVPCIVINDMFSNDEIDCSGQDEILLPSGLDFILTEYYKVDRNGNRDSRKRKNVYCLELRIK